jgi:hypothetical protein
MIKLTLGIKPVKLVVNSRHIYVYVDKINFADHLTFYRKIQKNKKKQRI